MSIENDETNQTEKDDLIETGSLTHNLRNSNYKFTTKELIITAILGVMGGFISTLIPFSLLIKTWYPLVGGTQLVSGHHVLWMAIVYGLTKKKSLILLTAVIQGFLAFLLGSSWGILEVGIYLLEGSSLLFGFFTIEVFKEDNTNLGWGIAGGIGNLTQVPFFWLVTGKIFILHYTLFIMSMMFAFASGTLIAGLLGKFVVERIKETGVLE